MKKLNSKKGFTLMEMLIVVAIIAILITIAIPTFTASLSKAKVAADLANLRSGYSEATTKALLNDEATTVEVGPMQASSDDAAATAKEDETISIGGYELGEDISYDAGDTVTITATPPTLDEEDGEGTVTFSN